MAPMPIAPAIELGFMKGPELIPWPRKLGAKDGEDDPKTPATLTETEISKKMKSL